MDSKQPPETPKELDFSIFHPMDHGIGEPYCWGWYGGPYRHLQIWWEWRVLDWIESILCKLGKHTYTDSWHRKSINDDYTYSFECYYCGKIGESK